MTLTLKRWLIAVGISLLIAPLLLFSQKSLQRPPRTNLELVLFEGISYKRSAHSHPRPYMLHTVAIDLRVPGVKPFVTPGSSYSNNREAIARTAQEFVKEFELQLAVNASHFYPFVEKAPWDFYPKSGDKVNVLGQAISQGESYSPPLADWPVLCFNPGSNAAIVNSGNCPVGTAFAVAGRPLLIEHGIPVIQSADVVNNDKPYPRLAIALDRTGSKLWSIVVDGKQPFYSEGVTLAELTEIAMNLGAYTVLNLDGGGSTTLAVNRGSGVDLLNAPIHTKLPMRQRPIANILGFFANTNSQVPSPNSAE